MMHLHRQLGAWLHGDALDLITVTIVDRVVHTPWAVNLPVINVLASSGRFQLVDNQLNVLHMILVGDQHRILGFDDYKTIHPKRCH
ncbi:hypothetical protein D3C78_1700200 [compost metagenome]